MPAVLITGMSGVGKSTILAALRARGWATVDLDDGWCIPQPDGTQLWDEPAVTRLLDDTDDADDTVLFVAGCEANMGVFVPRFSAVILLTAPWSTLEDRLRSRTTNAFGSRADERDRVRRDQREVEPLLRGIASACIDTRAPVDDVLADVLKASRLA